MFELWKDDSSRVRLDENSQVSSFLGAYWVDRTNWSEIPTPPYSAYDAYLNVHPETVFVMMGTTDGQTVSLVNLVAGNGVKTCYLRATGRAGMWFYAFGKRNIANSNSGLQFLDTDGNVTFDAQSKWLRLAGRVKSPTYGQDYPWPTGVPTIAVGMSQGGLWLQPTMVGQYISFLVFSYGLQVSTGLASMSAVVNQGPLGNANTPRPPPGDMFFADVTRY